MYHNQIRAVAAAHGVLKSIVCRPAGLHALCKYHLFRIQYVFLDLSLRLVRYR